MRLIWIFLFIPKLSLAKIGYQLVHEGLGIVWGMDVTAEEIYFTERAGKIKVLNLKTKKTQELAGVPAVYAKGQGGLLDIKLSPDFASSKKIFFTYAKKLKERQATALATAVIEENRLKQVKDIFISQGTTDTRRHFGSRIAFDGQAHIFVSVGDRGDRDNPQKLNNHHGKVIRLKLDGSVPKDTPFVKTPGALPEIWSFGHRNPQGLFFDQKSGQLFEMEHGPRGGDEINVIKKGANYGWPVISYGKEYWGPISVGEGTHKKGMEQPLTKYVPSIAPCGLTVYRGKKYPELTNKIIAGALKLTHLNVVNLKGEEVLRLFDDQDMRVRSVVTAQDQSIFFSTDGGKIFKLVND